MTNTENSPGINPVAQRQLADVINRPQPTRASYKVSAKGPQPLSPTETKQLANKAFRRALWHRETFLDALDAISRAIRLLDDKTLSELIWRGQHTPGHDGYTSTPDGERVTGEGGATKLNAVENAADARANGQPIPDPAGTAVADLMAALWGMSNAAAVVDRATQTLLHIHDTASAARPDSREICVGCNKEIGKNTKAHRIDGQPYHAEGSPNCYRAENWRRRGNGEEPQVSAPVGNAAATVLISEPPCQ